MNYVELVEAVGNLTNHPEMVGEITTAIQASTLKLHQADYYTRDAVEKLLVLDQDGYVFQVDIPSNFVRYRAIRWMRKWDPTGFDATTQQNSGAAGEFLENVDPEGIIDGYGYTKPNKWYVAGNNLNLRSNSTLRQLLISYYQMPKVAPVAQYSSWIADTVPFAIIFDAASLIFQTIAQQDQARKYDLLVLEQMRIVQQHGLISKGY